MELQETADSGEEFTLSCAPAVEAAYCELQYNCQLVFESPIENADSGELPLKNDGWFFENWPIIVAIRDIIPQVFRWSVGRRSIRCLTMMHYCLNMMNSALNMMN